ncbi:hypothetical protein QBC44DRAFT_348151 [Cladorrhinum sp. PSN332]|nr:hypothetical protein QBC44DRAFT_348151 [Cladorrhinum sp. PSN332]
MASSPTTQSKRRSLNGCRTCRKRHVKCDESRPTCLDCSRLGLECEYTPPLTRAQKRQPKNLPPRPLAQAPEKAPETVENDLGGQLISARAANWSLLDPVSDPCLFDLSMSAEFTFTPESFVQTNSNLFDIMPVDPFMSVSPTVDMQLDSTGLLACLPTLAPPTSAEREALDYYRRERYFGFGNKSPSWSTHAVLWETARASPAVLHLLLAASQTEIGWRSGSQTHLLTLAEENYRLGRQRLDFEVANGEVDPLIMVTAFWFLHWHIQHRRPSDHQQMLVRELGHRMTKYMRKYQLHQILAAMGDEDLGWPPAKKALVGRLIIWLFWVDTRARTLGEGGSLAKLLTEGESLSALADLYDMSKETQNLNWADYPDDELVDDIQNSQPLGIVHETLVLVQKVNNAADESLPLRPEASIKISADLDRFGRRSMVRSLIRLTKSTPLVRDRMLQNADWAIANYYALRIYHSRCSLQVADESFASPDSTAISNTVDSLMILLQKSLANEAVGQSDRLHWPLFWAGVETTDQFKQEFILCWLKDQRLRQAMRQIFQMQETGVRLGMIEIRQVLQTSCATLDVGIEM